MFEFGLDGSCGFADVMRDDIFCPLSVMISFLWLSRSLNSFSRWVMKSSPSLGFIWFGDM